MVARGHSLHTLLNDYPISTLREMMKAGSYNHRSDVALQVQGQAVAVLHGLDCGFNKGKQKLLTKFMNSLLGKRKKQKASSIDDAGQQLFSLFSPRK